MNEVIIEVENTLFNLKYFVTAERGIGVETYVRLLIGNREQSIELYRTTVEQLMAKINLAQEAVGRRSK